MPINGPAKLMLRTPRASAPSIAYPPRQIKNPRTLPKTFIPHQLSLMLVIRTKIKINVIIFPLRNKYIVFPFVSIIVTLGAADLYAQKSKIGEAIPAILAKYGWGIRLREMREDLVGCEGAR